MKIFKKMVSLKRFIQSPLEVLSFIEGDGDGEAIQLIEKGRPIYVIITQENYLKLLEDRSWLEEHVDGKKPINIPSPTKEEVEQDTNEFLLILNEGDVIK